MRSILYLAPALLFWPLLVFALPIPSCLDFGSLSEDGASTCELFEPAVGWALEEGPIRHKARSAKEPADADAIPTLATRENIVEHSIKRPEGPMHRAVAFALAEVEKEGPKTDSRAIRTLKKHWSIRPTNTLLGASEPDDATDAATGTTPERRWELPQPGGHIGIAGVLPPPFGNVTART